MDVEGMEIAVVGMAGRLPGARNVGESWRNLADLYTRASTSPPGGT